jgi:RNA-directed DNA polymerase
MKEGKSFEVSQKQVLEAYKRVKANQGAAGIDGVTFVEYEKDLKNNLYTLWNRMASGSYFPKAVRGVEIPKKNGKKRLLGIPTITDRVAQMVVKMSFEPRVEPIFCDDSYGYRPNKSALDAVGVTRERCWNSPWVLEFDIKGLFDNIDHDLMMQVVRKHTDIKWVVMYIERFLKADMVMPDGTVSKRTSGTPQGGVISPVLANLYMHYAFDRWMVTRNPMNQWARYADDGVVHCRTREEAEGLLERLKKRLAECRLEIHPDKTRIVYCRSDNNPGRHEHESFDFLGYTFRRRLVRSSVGKYFNGFTPAVSKSAAQKFRDRMRELRGKGKMTTPEEMARILNPVIRGWMDYFSRYTPSEAKDVLNFVNQLLARWLRRRYRRIRGSLQGAFRWLFLIYRTSPDLFYHWQMGIRPTMKMTRAV